jgi:threonine dehydratase
LFDWPEQVPDLDAIREAAERIAPFVHRTPVLRCAGLDRMVDATLYFKCENQQKVGAFKARGAHNAVFSLDDEAAARGVATHSSGNHAQALALAARNRGIAAHVVMPSNSAAVKVEAVRGYGASITFCDPTLEARETTLDGVVAETGATFVHPYDNYAIIAGQATAALELVDEVPDLDAVLAPVGGGGLLSGTALSIHYLSPRTRVIAAEPAGADDAFRSFEAGRIIPQTDPRTIADGLRTSLGERNFPIIQEHVERVVTVSEQAIVDAMRAVWERMKTVVEPSAAVPLAALLDGGVDLAGRRVGIIFSGGNVDLAALPW